MARKKLDKISVPRPKRRGAPVPAARTMPDIRKQASRAACRGPVELDEYAEELQAVADKTVIYHNPRCGTSRKTLQMLRDRGIEPEIIEYLKQSLSRKRLKELIEMLGIEPRELMRKKEKLYRELGLDDPSLSDNALLDAMAENPILIERPIVVRGQMAALGRPPEKILDIL